MVKHLDHLNMTVADLDATLAWYRDLFGFEPVERGRNGDLPWVIVRAGDAMLCLYQGTPESPETTGTLNHFALRVTDPTAFLERVEAMQVPFDWGDGLTEYPHSRAWYVRDPNGTQIEVVAWHDDTVAFR